MENDNLLFSTKRGRIILIVGGIFVIAIIALFFVFVLGYGRNNGSGENPPETEHFHEEVVFPLQ